MPPLQPPLNRNEMGRHSIEVGFGLLTQLPKVQFSAFSDVTEINRQYCLEPLIFILRTVNNEWPFNLVRSERILP